MTINPEDTEEFVGLLAGRLIDAGYLDFDVDVVADIIITISRIGHRKYFEV